jgi:uncharacterized protein (TIRG00374 family)
MMSFLVKFGASIILLVVLAYQVDLSAAVLRLGSLGLGTVTACLCLSLLQFTALGYRWNLVNRMLAMNLPLAEALRCTLASQFFSQGLPASIGGDALRIWWLSRLGSPMATAVQSVLLDRAAGLIALAALNIVAVATLFRLANNAQSATSIAPVVIAAILMIAVGTSRLVTKLIIWLRIAVRAKFGRHSSLMRTLSWGLQLQRGMWRLVYSRSGPGILLLGVAIHLAAVFLCYVVAVEAGISITFLQLLAIVPAVMLLSYLPLSIGGWGLREGAMAVGLNLIGVPTQDGAFLGLALGSLSLGAALIGALVWLISPMPVTVLGRRRTAD